MLFAASDYMMMSPNKDESADNSCHYTRNLALCMKEVLGKAQRGVSGPKLLCLFVLFVEGGQRTPQEN